MGIKLILPPGLALHNPAPTAVLNRAARRRMLREIRHKQKLAEKRQKHD